MQLEAFTATTRAQPRARRRLDEAENSRQGVASKIHPLLSRFLGPQEPMLFDENIGHLVENASKKTFTYEYDTKGRLWKATPNGGPTSTYVFDQNGNRTSAPSQTLAYDAQDRISTSGYQHDNDGRMLSPNGGSHVYTWDDFGSLIAVDLPNNIRIEYTYDGLQRRVTRKKLDNSVVVDELRYLYAEDGRLVAILDSANTVLDQYIYATGSHTPDAVVIDNLELYRIAQDHLGSVRLVLKASDGTVAQRVDYDAFGTITTQTGAGFQAFGFAGGLVDPDTGLVQMGARWYSPAHGRFISKDPTLFDGGDNLYGYANGDPVNFVDSNGRVAVAAPWLVKGGMYLLAAGATYVAAHAILAANQKAIENVCASWDWTWTDITSLPKPANDVPQSCFRRQQMCNQCCYNEYGLSGGRETTRCVSGCGEAYAICQANPYGLIAKKCWPN